MRWIAVGAAVVVVFDALNAWASGAFNLEYAHPVALAVSTLLYAAPAFLAARDRHLVRAGTATGAAVAGIDATIGWAVSSGIGATSVPTDAASLLLVVALVIGWGAVVGSLAGVLARVDRPSSGPTGGRHLARTVPGSAGIEPPVSDIQLIDAASEGQRGHP